jgi:uncharacterized protein YegL
MATHIHFILDRSGSMDDCLDDTIGGFNSFLRSQQELVTSDKCTLSLYQFDHEYEVVYQEKDIKDVQRLDRTTFVPRGNTALYDAIGLTVKSVSQLKYNSDDKIVIVILTDGFENMSKEYNQSSISRLIKEYDAKENWSFVFLAANQDAILAATKVGISQHSAMNFSQTPASVQKCYANLSSAIHRQRTTPGHSKVLFTEEEANANE